MVTLKLAEYDGTVYENLGFALPIDGVRTIVDAIIENGQFTGKNPIAEGGAVSGLGGFISTAGKWHTVNSMTGKVTASSYQSAGAYYAAAAGFYVTSVSGEAAAIGLQKGDIVLRINGRLMVSTSILTEELNRYWSDDTVTLTVLRGSGTSSAGTEITLEMTVVTK